MPVLRPREIGLITFLVLLTMMIAAFFFQIPPHPPLQTPGFAMGPFLGASLAATIAALFAGNGKWGQGLSLLATGLLMVSFGPHKWFDPLIWQIWLAIVSVQLAALAVLYDIVRAYLPMAGGDAA